MEEPLMSEYKRITLVVLLGVFCVLLMPTMASTQCGDSPQILGVWEWEKSEGGIAGELRTPDTEGFTLQLEFLESGVVREYVDGSLLRSSTFSFNCQETDRWGWAWALRTVTQGGFELRRVTFREDPATVRLILEDSWDDGFISVYAPRALVPVQPRTWGWIKSSPWARLEESNPR
jgi:hypothetical protein